MHVPTTTGSKGKSGQSAWLASLTDTDVKMDVSPYNFIFPAFIALSSNNKPIHIIDTSTTIHCTPYCDLLFNVHIVSIMLLTVANSEQLVLNLAGNMIVKMYTITHFYLSC
jgi:hypothetical protein